MEKTVNIHAAKTQLSALIAEAEAGADIVIARAGKPAVRLVPVKKKAAKPKNAKPRFDRTPGFMKGQIWMSPDFDEPLPASLFAALNGDRG
jgi:prevent-host-death family protein